MVLHAVRTERRLQTVSNMFIVSLAIADLIVGLVVMPISTVYIFTEHWLLGVAVCQIWIGVDYTASTASILNLFILSLDRYWSVRSPLKYLRKRTKKRAVLMITGVWCLSSMWIIPILGWHHFFYRGERTVPSNVCDTEYAKNSAFKVVTAFFNFYLPLAIMYCLYWKIFQEIRKRSEMELGQRNVKQGNMQISNMNTMDEISYYSDNILDSESTHSRQDDNQISQYPMGHSFSENSLANQLTNSHSYTAMKESGRRDLFLRTLMKKPKKLAKRNKRITNGETVYRTRRPGKETCKIEYVYDENVIDAETEKIERYYYEDFSNKSTIHAKSSAVLVRNTSNASGDLSPMSTPISSCSSSEDRRKTNYTLTSGLKRIREAETIIDSMVTTAGKKTGQRNAFVFRDERIQRHSQSNSVLNIKNKIRNMKQSSALRKEIKAARQLGVIMGAFTLCFLPYFILFLVVAFCDGCIDQGLLLAMTWIGYLNSTLNPFLYPLCNANFRRKFRTMLQIRTKRAKYKNRNGFDKYSLTTARYD
ncbi:histamine H1 receptor-like [Dreissena polymorpha]|nr:histamine H1 receptor-like [Dreissena polymorpha]